MVPLFLSIVALSTPITIYLVYGLEVATTKEEIEWIQIVNGLCFSSAMCMVWLWPLIGPGYGSWRNRARAATFNWHLWLSGMVVIAFQSLHNWCVPLLAANRGKALNWAFETYALSDDRWIAYQDDGWLPLYVYYINVNDVCLSVLVLASMLLARNGRFSAAYTVISVFRDATMFRETVEYLYDQHFLGYPYSTSGPLRSHAIVVLWLVNICWIISPMLNVWVAIDRIQEAVGKAKTHTA